MSGPSTEHTGQPGNGGPRPERPITATTEQCRPANQRRLELEEESDPHTLAAINAQLRQSLQNLTHTYRELEGVVSATGATLIFVDRELRVLRFTPKCKDLFGLDDNDFGEPVGFLAGKLNYANIEDHTKEVLRTAKRLEAEVVGRDGRWYLVRLRPEFADDGRVEGTALSFDDVTPQKEAEMSTHRAHHYASEIVETLQEPIIVLTADLRVKSANAAFYRTFQHRAEAVEGQPIFSIGDGQWDCPMFRELLERVLPNNEHYEGFELTHDFSGVGERTLLLNFRRLDAEQLVLLTVHDITSSRQVESLRDRESSLIEEVGVRRRLQEMASAVLQSGTMQEVFDHVLQAGADLLRADKSTLQVLTETGEPELVAQQGFPENFLRLSDAVKSNDSTACRRALRDRQRVTVGDIREGDHQACYEGLEEQVGFRALQSTPLISRSGNLLGVLSTYYEKPRQLSIREEYALDLLARETADLCEWLKTEKRLRQSETRLRAQSEQLLANDRQKNQFLGLLGHELRNPLTVMRNSIQTLVAEEHAFVSDPRISEALALLERQSRHMTHLVNDLLDITRINNGKVVLRRGRVSLPRCLDEVLAAHRSTLASRELEFSVDKPHDSIYLDADAARLFQVLDNLLTNAIKFTQPGGSINVSMSKHERVAVISVKDTGIGIPPESIDSLFRPFTQVDNTLACHGLGLGLSLVKSLIDLHGGDIRAYSEGEDEGSEFVIHWPLHKSQSEPANDATPPSLQAGTAVSPQRILVVDDIADIAESFARLLEVAGHEVLVAYDGEQGLALARQHRPTVAFLDMVMPDMDGLELGQQLRREFDPQDLTLVVVSGYGQSQDLERARAAGFEHHLLKPIEVQQVYGLLDKLNRKGDQNGQ